MLPIKILIGVDSEIWWCGFERIKNVVVKSSLGQLKRLGELKCRERV